MGAYVGGGSGSGDTHISQVISKGKKAVKKIPAKVVKKAVPKKGGK
jgi:hypothetical protein